MEQLVGKVAVVTGAASGIGRALAEALAARGMRIVIGDVDSVGLSETAALLRDRGAETVEEVVDVSVLEDVERLAQSALDAFGGAHVLCNNAGVDSGAAFEEVPMATWSWVIGVNFWGVVHGCRTFLPLMRQAGAGHIVNTASHAAFSCAMPAGAPYVASKAAVLALSENLFHEFAAAKEPIGISVLCPSFVRTRMPYAERNRPTGVPALDDRVSRRPIVEFLRARVAEEGLAPASVAEMVVTAIMLRRFFVLPHRERSIAAFRSRLDWLIEGVPPQGLRPIYPGSSSD